MSARWKLDRKKRNATKRRDRRDTAGVTALRRRPRNASTFPFPGYAYLAFSLRRFLSPPFPPSPSAPCSSPEPRGREPRRGNNAGTFTVNLPSGSRRERLHYRTFSLAIVSLPLPMPRLVALCPGNNAGLREAGVFRVAFFRARIQNPPKFRLSCRYVKSVSARAALLLEMQR